MEQAVFREIQHGLQLSVVYKKVIPTLEETEQQFLNFHSRNAHLTGEESLNRRAHILLFKDLESLESAKSKLDDDPNVLFTDYRGMRSAQNQANSVENCRVYLKFDVSPDEATVMKFDSRIEGVNFLRDKTTLFVQYPSNEEAVSAVKQLRDQIGTDGLRLVFESLEMKKHAYALSGIDNMQVVLRDVPKATKLKDIIQYFPDANRFVMYDKTFPASTFCHAVLGFKDTQRVTEILAKKEYTIMGKKVYAVPAHCSLLQNHPGLGLTSSDVMKAATQIGSVSVPPFNKKMKLDEEDANKGQDDDDSWEDIDSDEEGDAGDGNDTGEEE